MDAGGNLTAPFLLQQGYRPVIDFGYIYGHLPLLVDRLWLDLAGATPVICTNVASMPEIVENGVSGFVVPPNDPAALRERICWLRDHPVEAAAMGREGRRRVLDKFPWPQVVQRCIEIYRS